MPELFSPCLEVGRGLMAFVRESSGNESGTELRISLMGLVEVSPVFGVEEVVDRLAEVVNMSGVV